MPLPKMQARLPKVLARDQVYQQLRLWIVGGVLKPGEKLNFHEIGRQLGFSVIPIREACMRLHYEGFVEMAHSRWTRVLSLDASQAIEVCEAIKALEVYALEIAIPFFRESDIRRLRVINQSLRGAVDNNEIQEALLADEQFHAVWIERSSNGKIAELLADLKDRLRIAEGELVRSEHGLLAASNDHDTIIEALLKRNSKKAVQLLHEHWQFKVDRLQSTRRSEIKEIVTRTLS